MPTRYFTVEEANAALLTLRPVVAAMLKAREKIVAARPDLWPVLEKAASNGGNDKGSAVVADFEIVRRRALAIEGLGIQLKDINTRLVHFLARADGPECCVCWGFA